MNWTLDRVRAAQDRILRAEGLRFDQLVELTGLDPARDFRLANLSGVDFRNCDLRGFDFSGARLWGCRFDGARIEGARFDKAEFGPTDGSAAMADLRESKDWAACSRSWERGARPTSDLYLPRHTVFQDAPFAPQLCVIPAGRFLMGSPENEPERREGEGPQREVVIERSFALGRFAVTFEEYDAFCNAAGAMTHKDQGWGRGRRPAINVSCEDAEAYCAWLTERTGAEYRLPSEAEWEYACRAGTDTPFWWGEAIDPQQANYDGDFVYAGGGSKGVFRQETEPVDSFTPNQWGLYQTHGNVWEWCADHWYNDYDGAPIDGSAWMERDESSAVLRGGSWFNYPQYLRSAYRGGDRRDVRVSYIGFRVARTLVDN